MTPRISVIVPVYNGEAYIEEAIRSVLDGPLVDALQILVVDDGSADRSVERALACGPSVRVVRQPNQGRSAARNTGLREATGDLVAFLDADDRYAPGKLERQVAYLQERPEAIGVLTSLQRFGHVSGPVREPWSDDAVRALSPTEFLVTDVGHPASLLVRRHALKNVAFPVDLSVCEDRVFLGLIRRAGPIGYLDDHLYCYRVTGAAGAPADRWRRFDALMHWCRSSAAEAGMDPEQVASRIWATLAQEVESDYFAREMQRFSAERERLRALWPLSEDHSVFHRRLWPRWLLRLKDAVDSLR